MDSIFLLRLQGLVEKLHAQFDSLEYERQQDLEKKRKRDEEKRLKKEALRQKMMKELKRERMARKRITMKKNNTIMSDQVMALRLKLAMKDS